MTELPFAPPGPLPFRVLLDEALRQARRYFRAIYPGVAIPITVVATAVATAQALWFSHLKEDLGTLKTPLLNPGYLALLLVYGLLMMIAYNTMQVAAIDALAGRPIDLRRAWRFTVRGRVFWTLVLWYAATLASAFCCCLPALVVAPLLTLIPAVMADEGRFGLQAISRSSQLTWHFPRDRWWASPLVKTLLLLLVGVLLAYLTAVIVSLPFQIPMYIGIFRKAAAGEDVVQAMSAWVWLQVPAQLLSSLASTAVYLYVCFGVALLFYDTRGRREGSDLRATIDLAFPAGEPPPPPPSLGELRP